MSVVHPPIRRIRSFVRREGKMTESKEKAWQILWSRYGLSVETEISLDLDREFGRFSEKVLEIGFGDGHSLIQMAASAPEKDFLGIEIYRTGVSKLLLAIERHKLTNIRILCMDAVEVLEHKIEDKQLMAVHLFFPDPWPKTRHHKRRLVQPFFVDLIARKLKEGGIFHLCTDWMDYAYHMMSVISANKHFLNVAGTGQFTPRPNFRPITKYEQKGLKLGHQTRDLVFRRVDG